MDGLSPHIEYRVESLQREAEARRLAASAIGSPRGPEPPRRGHRGLAIATTLVALAVVAGTTGAYLTVAASPESTASSADAPAVVDAAPVPAPTSEIGRGFLRLPRAGGILAHR